MSEQEQQSESVRIGEPIRPALKFFGAVIPDAVMSSKSIPLGAKILLARLHKFALKSDRCNPSIKVLVQELAATQDQISRWLHALEKSGFIRTIRRQRREAERVILLAPELVSSLRPPWSELGSVRNQEATLDNTETLNQDAVLISDRSNLDFGLQGSLISGFGGRAYKERAHLNQGTESTSESVVERVRASATTQCSEEPARDPAATQSRTHALSQKQTEKQSRITQTQRSDIDVVSELLMAFAKRAKIEREPPNVSTCKRILKLFDQDTALLNDCLLDPRSLHWRGDTWGVQVALARRWLQDRADKARTQRLANEKLVNGMASTKGFNRRTPASKGASNGKRT